MKRTVILSMLVLAAPFFWTWAGELPGHHYNRPTAVIAQSEDPQSGGETSDSAATQLEAQQAGRLPEPAVESNKPTEIVELSEELKQQIERLKTSGKKLEDIARIEKELKRLDNALNALMAKIETTSTRLDSMEDMAPSK